LIWCLSVLLLTSPRSRLRWEISRLPQKPTVGQQLKVSHSRALLAKKIIKGFLHNANSFLPPLEEVDLSLFEYEVKDTPSDKSAEPEVLLNGALDDDFSCDDEDESEAPSVLLELVVLPLPSSIISPKLSASINSMISTEMELRKGQANDTLEGVRIGLANKSLFLQTNVNQRKSTKQSTRAWASV
jgi:hypothetical protein